MDVPDKTEVLIVGSGYTGLSAALTLSRAGKEVVVADSGLPGSGASSRNAGFVGRTLKHSFSSVMATRGLARAKAVYAEVQAAFDYVCSLIEDEAMQCYFARCGRYMAATSPRHYDAMARELALKEKHLGDQFEMVPRSQQHTEIGTDRYFGGAILPQLASLHPGLYHQCMRDLVLAAGVLMLDQTVVTSIARLGDSFRVETSRGAIDSRDVVVATNGYTGRLAGDLNRRLVPFRGYMFATEPMETRVIDAILPTTRTVHDYNHNLLYMRRAPDGPRLLFGGLTGCGESDEVKVAMRLHDKVSAIFPAMREVRVSHAWSGLGGAAFDLYPHIGRREGVYYALGYCFAGLPMGTYLGHKVALRVMGHPDAVTVFDNLDFPCRFYYWGRPWFVPWVMRWYDRLDRAESRRSTSVT